MGVPRACCDPVTDTCQARFDARPTNWRPSRFRNRAFSISTDEEGRPAGEMWFWLWFAFVFFLLVLPLSYGWGYRGWGPPYPSYYRRRRRGMAVAVSDPPAEARPLPASAATGWGWAADVLCTLFVVAVAWLVLAVLV